MEQIKIPLIITGELGLNKIYAGVHWSKRSKDKNNIRLLIKSIVGKREPYSEPVSIKMRFNSRLDVSNHGYLFKLIEDGLVKCKVIVNDNDKYVKSITMCKQKEYEGVIVEIEEG